MSSSLHGLAASQGLDLGAFLYATRRLPSAVWDARVVVMEGVNARHLDALPEPVDVVTGDLSFISLGLVLPAVQRILAPAGDVVVLVKPQFEAGRDAVGKGGKAKGKDLQGNSVTVERAVTLRRWTFVIGKDGKIAYKNTKVNPAQDSKQVTEFIEKRPKK